MKSTDKILKWKTYIFFLKKGGLINNKLLSTAVNNFWNIIVTKTIEDTNHIALLVSWPKAYRNINGTFVTLSKMVKLNILDSEKENLIKYIFNLTLSVKFVFNEYFKILFFKLIQNMPTNVLKHRY